jgi:hypothetical protein
MCNFGWDLGTSWHALLLIQTYLYSYIACAFS